MRGNKIAAEMEQWWTDHAERHDDAAWMWYLADYQLQLGHKFAELSEKHSNNGPDGKRRFGMAGAGSCTRKAGLKVLGHEEEPFDGSTLVTFHIGHLLELLAICTLNACGHEVRGAQAPVEIQPMMTSFHDGTLELDGKKTILSVKSSAYKMSGQQRGKWMRRGFTELPFEGVRKAQPSWWAQAQAEMHGAGIEQTLVVAVSKDIVQVFKKDPYMMDNGSLTFYTETLEYDPLWCQHELLPIWGQAWDAVTDGRAPGAFVYNPEVNRYIKLPKPGDSEAGWGGPNQQATGSFNPCGGCGVVEACKGELAKEWRR